MKEMSKDTVLRITTIEKVRFTGKWVEYWFSEDSHADENNVLDYDESSKGYMLMDAISRADIYDDVISNGLKGRVLVWEKDDYNYHPKNFIIPPK